MMNKPEILAPAGSPESLEAAVRSGADAVYLGGKSLNARQGAANFSDEQLAEAIRYCHIRGVAVYQTLNTIVFPHELSQARSALETACCLGVDGIIVQDMAVASLARRHAPDLPLHASTQMAVHNLDGVRMLEQLSFSRVVLARELSLREIEFIASRTALQLEVFVHGALCMCVSGQCYLSAMIGGRSGNRGLCAQPCRLPFRSGDSAHALSLKDLSAVPLIPKMAEAGIASLKIEGRLKRPEYVAAAVTACRQSRAGEAPDMDTLRAVFSRSGFTNGYLEDELGDDMFGTRQKEDVVDAGPVFGALRKLYSKERQSIPLSVELTVQSGAPVTLSVDCAGYRSTVSGNLPEPARTAPLSPERARTLLEKTGGTPFFVEQAVLNIEDGLMVPASELNGLRRRALEEIEEARGATVPHSFTPFPLPEASPIPSKGTPSLRVRVQQASQLTEGLLSGCSLAILPANQLDRLSRDLLSRYRDRLAVELPRIHFGDGADCRALLETAKVLGISRAVAGNLGSVFIARELGFSVHGDFSLNVSNPVALAAYQDMGLCDCTLSFELSLERARMVGSAIPTGLLAYGTLPLMIFRNAPAGTGGLPRSSSLVDRKNNRFPLVRQDHVVELGNMTPLYLADRLEELAGFSFLTLYFTSESPARCRELLEAYRNGTPTNAPKTRGLYFRKVL